ncbi:hypothetical protein [Proteus mirabilis]|uniref:hypothetical protein n=1 Tax=Proteus mirabilis TaxID=584 RepID=UPI0034E59A7C
MLSDTLKKFNKIYNELWSEIRNIDKKNDVSIQHLSDEDILILECLVNHKIFQLKAFEILLYIAPDNAVNLLKRRYLSLDLSNNSKDHVADLEIMLSDVKEILGNAKFEEILNCSDFLLVNKKNKRVIEAIDFARGNI